MTASYRLGQFLLCFIRRSPVTGNCRRAARCPVYLRGIQKEGRVFNTLGTQSSRETERGDRETGETATKTQYMYKKYTIKRMRDHD